MNSAIFLGRTSIDFNVLFRINIYVSTLFDIPLSVNRNRKETGSIHLNSSRYLFPFSGEISEFFS